MVMRRNQMALDESPIESEHLAELLGNRERAKESLKGPRKKFKDADSLVKAQIGQLELADGTYRCGEFVVKISEAEEKHIEFERTSSKRISIKPAKT